MTSLVRLTQRLLLSIAVVFATTLSGSILSGLDGTVYAQEAEQPERKTRKTPAMREKVYSKLAEAQAAAEANDNASAPENSEPSSGNDRSEQL